LGLEDRSAAAGAADSRALFISDYVMSQLAKVADAHGGHIELAPW
jgi:hypothetical protein